MNPLFAPLLLESMTSLLTSGCRIPPALPLSLTSGALHSQPLCHRPGGIKQFGTRAGGLRTLRPHHKAKWGGGIKGDPPKSKDTRVKCHVDR